MKISDDEWVSGTITVKKFDASQYVPVLMPLIAKDGYLAAHSPSGTLIFTARHGMVKRIIELVDEIDEKPQRSPH